ncbi:uncharacterized protein LOC131665762 [Phymastichus coffea]|uniref:uncharacterized protein LOC131665762 n=1 Tax=Phymastichus coffea TaxID=108790 RepID=UPI00273AA50F|nr:uncharacterized protein LOC131665762 [Phymastichus coffea]
MENMNKILTIIDFYCETLENPEVLSKEDMNLMKQYFQTCMFIEQLIKKVQKEKKEIEFESHIKTWMLNKKKNITYKCTDLSNACDKIFELYLKQEKVSNEFVDEVIKVYVENCGSIRLRTNINHIMMNSMQANTILQLFKNLDISESDIEDELRIASWENEIKVGKKKKVIEYLIEMFDKQHISKLIKMAYKSKSESTVNLMILEFFTKKLEGNDVQLYSELKDLDRKVLLKLLNDNSKFQLSYVDTTFYIGRNMNHDKENYWITDSGFSYSDLKNVINCLLDGPDGLYEMIINRIKTAKELDAVWNDIEKHCML